MQKAIETNISISGAVFLLSHRVHVLLIPQIIFHETKEKRDKVEKDITPLVF